MPETDPIQAVYAIRHKASGAVYVGSTINWPQRRKNHEANLRTGRVGGLLRRTLERDGAEAFEFVVLETVAKRSQLRQREQHWIDALHATTPPNFNTFPAIGSNKGVPSDRYSSLNPPPLPVPSAAAP